jgi:Copper amine oxidase N-terminal domain.
MKKLSKWSHFLLGMLCAVFVFGMAIPAMAAERASKTIEVVTGIDIYIDDIKLYPTDANGKPVDVLVYNGTTYLPVRAVSSALGLNVAWDGATPSVYVGKHAADNKPAVPLYDLPYFAATGIDKVKHETIQDNLGVYHDTTYYISSWVTKPSGSAAYVLNGKYSAFTGTFFLPYSLRASSTKYEATIYCDGRQVWTGTVANGIKPIDFMVNLSDVNEMVIEISSNQVSSDKFAYFGDTMFFT